MKKNKIIVTILAGVLAITTLLLTIFCIPNKIPVCVGLTEKIILLGSKWILIANSVLPIALGCAIFIKKTPSAILNFLLVLCFYENFLILSYFCLNQIFEIQTVSQIPLAASVFLPVACAVIYWSQKIKNAPYKSFWGIKNKYTTETEFIWKQIQIYSKDFVFGCGVILFLISIVFMFIRQPLIATGLFVIAFIITYLLVTKEAKHMYKKYKSMKAKKDKMEEDTSKETPKDETK